MNSINPHIQFTVEQEENNTLSFLDTKTIRQNGLIKVAVYRKPTHTDKYLDYNSHHPQQHKRSVVNTLLKRAGTIPSSNRSKRAERKHVIKVLRENNYPRSFIRDCEKVNKTRQLQSTNNDPVRDEPTGFVLLPYVGGLSEKISRLLRNHGVKVAHKPMQTLQHYFPKPREPKSTDQNKSIVYQIKCTQCQFVYYGQTERCLKTRLTEHKKAVFTCDSNSKVAQHANNYNHTFDFENVKIVDRATQYHQRLFLEAWHSIADPHSGNDHVCIPEMYKSLMNNS